MERIWNKNNDNGAVHAIGNGRICVYEIGPEILQAFGYPYSAGTCFSLSSGAEHCISRRKPAQILGSMFWITVQYLPILPTVSPTVLSEKSQPINRLPSRSPCRRMKTPY